MTCPHPDDITDDERTSERSGPGTNTEHKAAWLWGLPEWWASSGE